MEGQPITIFYEMQLQIPLEKIVKPHLIGILEEAGIPKQEYIIQEGKRKGKEKTIVQLIQVIRDKKISEDTIEAYLKKAEVKNFKPVSNDQTTHYKVWKDGQIFDPYKLYQARNTQGFCQMFAWFIAAGDTSDFVEVTAQSNMTSEKFHNLALNTQRCAQKTIHLIRMNEEVKEKFNEGFLEERADKSKGIAGRTTLDRYLKDFEKINADLRRVKDYVIDQKKVVPDRMRLSLQREYHGLMKPSTEETIESESQKTVRRSKREKKEPERLGVSPEIVVDQDSLQLPPDPDLCVQPTDGSPAGPETQYESFITVFASIMGATSERNEDFNPSPYDLLCQQNKFLVMPVEKGEHPEDKIKRWAKKNSQAWAEYERGELEEGIPPEPQIPEDIPPEKENSQPNTHQLHRKSLSDLRTKEKRIDTQRKTLSEGDTPLKDLDKRKRRRTRRKRRRRSSTSR